MISGLFVRTRLVGVGCDWTGTGLRLGTFLGTGSPTPMQAEPDATLWRESNVPDQRGESRIRADARKRRAQDEKVE
jgi:hypothetical protein